MEILKKIFFAFVGIFVLLFAKEVVEFGTWVISLPLTLTTKLIGVGITLTGIYLFLSWLKSKIFGE